MIRIALLFTLIGVFQSNGVNTYPTKARKEEDDIEATTARMRMRIYDQKVLRTLKDIHYEEQRAGPGSVFSLTSLEVENCTDLCQGGNYLAGSCTKDCRAYFAIQRADEEIRILQQTVIEQNQQYQKRMRSVIIVFPIVIVILVVLNQIQVKQRDKQRTEEREKKLSELKNEIEEKIQHELSHQKLYTHPDGERPDPNQPLLEKETPQ